MKIRTKTVIMLVIAAICIVYASLYGYQMIVRSQVGANTRIVVIFKATTKEMEFWKSVREGVNVAAKEFGVQAIITGPLEETDVDDQHKIIEDTIAERPDAIVLAAGDFNRTVPFAQMIKDAGIPLITIDSGLNSDISDSFIATDNSNAGGEMAKALLKLVDTSKPVVVGIVSHVKGSATAIGRETGLRDGLSENKSIQMLETVFCDANAQKSYTLTKDMLQNNPDIDAIAALNEPSTTGAGRAIQELGLVGKVKLIGFDCSMDEIKMIESGVIQATVVQKPFNMGYLGVEMAVRAIKHEKIDKRMDTGNVVIDKTNIYTDENQKLLFPFIDN